MKQELIRLLQRFEWDRAALSSFLLAFVISTAMDHPSLGEKWVTVAVVFGFVSLFLAWAVPKEAQVAYIHAICPDCLDKLKRGETPP